MKLNWKVVALAGTIGFYVPAFGADIARPGTVNYIEGSVALDGRQLRPRDVGSIEMQTGSVLETGAGKAEILLTPGVFVRMGENSAVKMLSPSLTPTRVEVDRGLVGVEVDELYKQNDLEVVDGGVVTQLIKTGYYEFDSARPTVLVFKGKAAVEVSPDKYTVVKGGHSDELVPDGKMKAAHFDEKDAEGPLYNWSSLRSEYLAEANNQIAGQYGGAGFNPGWYWDPYTWDYTYLGWDPFWSPFGFGFYPMGWGWGGWGRGWGGRGWGGHPYGGFSRGGFAGGGFHGGGGGARGGGGRR